jgi:hypothetical protein
MCEQAITPSSGIDDVHVIDPRVHRVTAVRAHDVDRVIRRFAEREVGNRHPRGHDLDDLGSDIVAVEDDRLADAAGRTQRDVRRGETQVDAVQRVISVGDEDGRAGGGIVHRGFQFCDVGDVNDRTARLGAIGSADVGRRVWGGQALTAASSTTSRARSRLCTFIWPLLFYSG